MAEVTPTFFKILTSVQLPSIQTHHSDEMHEHPSELSVLPFQTMRSDEFFEATTQYDRNPNPHPPIGEGESGSFEDVQSLFGHSPWDLYDPLPRF